MKKIILSAFLFLIINLEAISQPYHSLFAKDTTQWNVYELVPDAGWTWAYYSFSDTLIKESIYHKLYREQIYDTNQFFGKNYSWICGYIREDTAVGKYWYLIPGKDTTMEVLLMDMNLTKGDSFLYITDATFASFETVAVDSVYYENDRKVIELDKSYYSDRTNSKVKFINGIGPSSGFFPDNAGESSWGNFGLICKFENGIHVFSTEADFDGNCFYAGGADIKKIRPDKWIDIYPNPATIKITIQLNNMNYQNSYLFLFNVSGSLIINRPINSEKDYLEIPQNGIYFLKVVSGNMILVKKIIVIGN
jgi:hypothetical protein